MTITTDRQFNRYSIAYFNFEKAEAFAKEAESHHQSTLAFEALVFAAIVSYYRPFSPNEKDPLAPAESQLRIEDIVDLSPEEQELHNRCKTLRNKALAHSEFSFNPTRLDPYSRVVASRPFSLLNQPIAVDALRALLEKLIRACHLKRGNYALHKEPND